jgi:hypothetical protein
MVTNTLAYHNMNLTTGVNSTAESKQVLHSDRLNSYLKTLIRVESIDNDKHSSLSQYKFNHCRKQ